MKRFTSIATKWSALLLSLLIFGCATGPRGEPLPAANTVCMELCNEAGNELSVKLDSVVPPADPEFLSVIAVRSPLPNEVPTGTPDGGVDPAEVRQALARAIRLSNVARRCDVTSVATDEARQLRQLNKEVDITGELDPSRQPKIYHPDRVYVVRGSFSVVDGVSSRKCQLFVHVWHPRTSLDNYNKVFERTWFKVSDGWVLGQ